MNTNDLIYLARCYLNANESAVYCLADAIMTRNSGRPEVARKWALRSLAHSVGILSPVWRQANGGRDCGLEVTT